MPAPRRLATVCALLLAVLLGVPANAAALSAAEVERSVSRAVLSAKAGGSGAYVRDLTTGDVLYARHPDSGRVPASVEKLFTTAAALRRWGPAGRLTTRVTTAGRLDEDGRLDGNLVLVGGGDPGLSTGDLGRLARLVGKAGVRRVSGAVVGDESRFDTRRGTPRMGGAYDPDLGGVLGALVIDRGFTPGGPALGAARRFVRSLRARGIRVAGRTRAGRAPRDARTFARVRSPSMADIARATNRPSDNFYAEMLLKGLGASFGAGGTSAAGAAVVRAETRRLGVPPSRVADGSGLSRANRVTPRQVVGLLTQIRRTPQRQAFEESLAVAGRSGTLAGRMRGTSAAGACRGKTGTLNRVSALAGVCETLEGHAVAFAIIMNGVDVARARRAQDRAAAAIASYVSRPLVGRPAR